MRRPTTADETTPPPPGPDPAPVLLADGTPALERDTVAALRRRALRTARPGPVRRWLTALLTRGESASGGAGR